MRRAAFTLLETIIVVAIVVAISAVALPSLASRVTAGRVGQAVLSLQSSAALARADAMDQGRTLTLVAEDVEGEWVLFTEPASSRPSGIAALREPEPAPEGRREVGSFDGVDLAGTLPSADEPPASETAANGGARPAPLGGAGAPPAEPPERRELAVFFADGSCRSGGPIYVLGKDGSRRVVRFGAISASIDVRILPKEQDELSARPPADQPPRLLSGGRGGDR
ncbi:MAG: hypothetical protein IPJ41_16075 [Phycisphaerales bacterium]|nr:hypothetical protein [Phycisphaerales bacterium]